jgi:hypothetical protein
LGSNSSEGLWIAALGKQDLTDATDVYWFESGYDAMSYYQLHVKDNPSLEKAVFVSTGGNPTVGQMQRMLAVTPSARHHICFDNDLAGRQFTENLKGDCLLAVGDEELIKIHFHTNEPWKILEYGRSLGEIYDIVVEDMDRQSRGLHG